MNVCVNVNSASLLVTSNNISSVVLALPPMTTGVISGAGRWGAEALFLPWNWMGTKLFSASVNEPL